MIFLHKPYIKEINEYSQINFIDENFNVLSVEQGKDFGYLKTYSDEYAIPRNIKILK